MEDPMELAKMIHDTPGLFPYLVFACILLLLWKGRTQIKAVIDARVDAWTAQKENNALLMELIRNNTAALNNNTAALESVKADRGETRRQLNYHEQLDKERMEHHETASRERMERIQDTLDSVARTVDNNARDLVAIGARTPRRDI